MVRWFKYLIGLILATGLCLRMMGLYNGYPEIYFYDEFRFVGTASRILENADLNPHWFGHPGGFIIYLECIIIASITSVHFIWQLAHGQVEGFAEYIEIYGKNPYFNPAVFHFAGRLMIVLFALISIYMLYKIGKKHFHPIVGLLAAAVLALAPLHIQHSQKIRTDIATTMWILIAIWFLFEYIDDAKIRKLWVAAFCGGISVATKYTSGIILFPILFVAYKLNYHGLGFKGLLEDAIRFKGAIVWVLFLFFLGFFVFSPFVVLDFGAALKDMAHEARSIHPGAESDGIISNYIWYFKGALCKGIGNIVIEVVALFGFVLLLGKKDLKTTAITIFTIFYFLVVGSGRLKWARWMIPVLPFEAIFFGYAIYRAGYGTGSIKKSRFVIALTVMLAIVSLAWASSEAVGFGLMRMKPDSRQAARDWVLENIPAGSKIAYERLGPHLKKRYDDLYQIEYAHLGQPDKPIEYYEDNDFNCIILSGWKVSYARKDPERFPGRAEFQQKIINNYTLKKSFIPTNNPGPPIWIYCRNPEQNNNLQ